MSPSRPWLWLIALLAAFAFARSGPQARIPGSVLMSGLITLYFSARAWALWRAGSRLPALVVTAASLLMLYATADLAALALGWG